MQISSFRIPSDGQPLFIIDGQKFKINTAKSHHSISSSGEIYTELVAELVELGEKRPFLDEDNENGEVMISFSAKRIYFLDSLTGKFLIEEGSTGKPLNHYTVAAKQL